MNLQWIGISALIIFLQICGCPAREEISRTDKAKFKPAQKVINSTIYLRNTIAADIVEAIKKDVDVSKNASKGVEKIVNLINNGSISMGDVVNYLPRLMVDDVRLKFGKFVKNFKKNSLRNAATINRMLTTLTDIANNNKTFAERLELHEPATFMDTSMTLGRVVTDSIFNTMFWSLRRVPRIGSSLGKGEDDEEIGNNSGDDDNRNFQSEERL